MPGTCRWTIVTAWWSTLASTQASGIAEPTAALAMAAEIAGQGRVTLGADKGYDQKELVRALREYRVTPHVAQKVNSAITTDAALATPATCSASGSKRVEEIFGWLKTVAGLRKTRHRGIARVGWTFTFAAAAYNLVRMRNLLPVAFSPHESIGEPPAPATFNR